MQEELQKALKAILARKKSSIMGSQRVGHDRVTKHNKSAAKVTGSGVWSHLTSRKLSLRHRGRGFGIRPTRRTLRQVGGAMSRYVDFLSFSHCAGFVFCLVHWPGHSPASLSL